MGWPWPVSKREGVGQVSRQDMADSFNPPFHACLSQGGATCFMCSYNSVNGIPACANRELLTQLLRKHWKFEG